MIEVSGLRIEKKKGKLFLVIQISIDEILRETKQEKKTETIVGEKKPRVEDFFGGGLRG